MISRQEAMRQLMHLSLGILFALAYHLDVISLVHVAILLALSLVIYHQYRTKPLLGFKWFIERFERPDIRMKTPGIGAVYLLAGIFISMLLFSKPIAVASIMILAIGDSVAPLFGHLGKRKNPLSNDPAKLVEGSALGAVFAFIGAWVFVTWQLALVGSIVGMVFEAIEIHIGRRIDDNIVVPFTAGLAMTLFSLVL